MPQGDAQARFHTCPDGQVRPIEPVYFRIKNEMGNRIFKRISWFCYVCRYADGTWAPEEKGEPTNRV